MPVQDISQLNRFYRILVSTEEDPSARTLTFPVSNSLIPEFNFMLPRPSVVLNESIAEHLGVTSNAFRMHHPSSGGFKGDR